MDKDFSIDEEYSLREYERAIEFFSKAIELDTNIASNFYKRGLIYYYIDKLEEATNDYNKAIELDPNFLGAYVNRAVLYNSVNEYQKTYKNYAIVEELCNKKSELFEFNENLMWFFSSFNAPFLFNRIIKQLHTPDTLLSYENLILQNYGECSEIIAFLNYFEKTNLIDNNKFQLLKGVITYYMKDPSVCYKIFDEKVDVNTPDNLMGQYYFVLSCDDYLKSEPLPIMENAVKQANEYISIKDKTTDNLQLYYAGQIFFFNEDYTGALECFSQCNDFIPALCMQVNCYNSLKNIEKRDLLINDLLFLDKHNKGLLQYACIPKLSIEGFEELVMRYSHIREIEGVIPVLCDYASEMDDALKSRYKNIVPKTKEIFTIDKDTIEGKITIDKINPSACSNVHVRDSPTHKTFKN